MKILVHVYRFFFLWGEIQWTSMDHLSEMFGIFMASICIQVFGGQAQRMATGSSFIGLDLDKRNPPMGWIMTCLGHVFRCFFHGKKKQRGFGRKIIHRKDGFMGKRTFEMVEFPPHWWPQGQNLYYHHHLWFFMVKPLFKTLKFCGFSLVGWFPIFVGRHPSSILSFIAWCFFFSTYPICPM